ncbi:orotidine-5'-phosphate decarboxylase [Sphingosinicella xenopeptidilytica]|uniref:Orotidine 5'-phosphate decarboxylase n=1 Tax=Sphingosinicella xenopeptidilytica TaxID=364098 RepID=A0ABW3C353_SPHXN
MTNPIFCAVDTADKDHARALAVHVAGRVGGIKLGLEFFMANGREGVAAVAGEGGVPVFLDLKLHDIPNTVAGAVRSLASCPYDILTVHAGGGSAMMRAAKAAARPGAKVVGVTVLTSMDEDDLAATGVIGTTTDQVRRLAVLARGAGLDGIVCSAHEVAAMRAQWPEGFFVVPGIRPAGSAIGDQKRVMTPRQAMDAGASILVIGRPITGADDPGAAADAILQSL